MVPLSPAALAACCLPMSSEPSPARSEPSIESLLERNLEDVAAYVRNNLDPALRAKESVSDVVQSVCREVLDRKDDLSFKDEIAFRTYLYRSALRKVIDRRRYYLAAKRDVAREVALQTGDGDVPPSPEEATEALDRFEAAFAQLSETHQEVISLRRIFGMDAEAAGQRLGISASETRKRLARALARLAVVMGDHHPE